MSACGLLTANPNPSEAEIRHAIHGNLCRCTGYQHIVNAVIYAARKGAGQPERVRHQEYDLHVAEAARIRRHSIHT